MTAELEDQLSCDKDAKSISDDKTEVQEQEDSKSEERDVPVLDDEAVKPSKNKSFNFLERLFRCRRTLPNQEKMDVEAGTELLAADDRVKADRGSKKHDSGTDITIALTEDNPDDAVTEYGGKEEIEGLTGRAYLWRVIFALLIVMVVLLVVSLVSVLATSSDQMHLPTEPVVVTDCGPVRGVLEDSVYVFRKLPFALPPIGSRRWKPPVAPSTLEDCWTGVYEVQNHSVYCPQWPVPGEDVEYSEDCLYLDVITPFLHPTAPRPVVVYIPGDSLQSLSSVDFHWKPSPILVREEDVVFVTINYRLNVFGFMSLDVLSDAVQPPTSGNYGFMDQIAALRWVQKNIHSFGGDPNRVTIFGHGSGATSAVVLLSSRKSKDLFDQAWITGPSVRFSEKSLQDIAEENAVFLRKLQCDNLECLLEKNVTDILSATPNSWNLDLASDFPSTDEEPFPSVSIVDGDLLFDTPMKMWNQTETRQIPIVVGAMAQEAAAAPTAPDASSWSWADFSDYVSERLNAINQNVTGSVLELYINNSSSPEYQFHTMVSDVRVVCPLELMSTYAQQVLSTEVYSYVVDYRPSSPIQMKNDSLPVELSVHGLDVVAIFGLLGRYLPVLTPFDLTFQTNMQNLFFSFVHTGVPSAGSASLHRGRHLNLISNKIDTADFPRRKCEVWKDSGLFSMYAKMN